jgi:hypothetical protein
MDGGGPVNGPTVASAWLQANQGPCAGGLERPDRLGSEFAPGRHPAKNRTAPYHVGLPF